jgi:hypothetical protein
MSASAMASWTFSPVESIAATSELRVPSIAALTAAVVVILSKGST